MPKSARRRRSTAASVAADTTVTRPDHHTDLDADTGTVHPTLASMLDPDICATFAELVSDVSNHTARTSHTTRHDLVSPLPAAPDLATFTARTAELARTPFDSLVLYPHMRPITVTSPTGTAPVDNDGAVNERDRDQQPDTDRKRRFWNRRNRNQDATKADDTDLVSEALTDDAPATTTAAVPHTHPDDHTSDDHTSGDGHDGHDVHHEDDSGDLSDSHEIEWGPLEPHDDTAVHAEQGASLQTDTPKRRRWSRKPKATTDADADALVDAWNHAGPASELDIETAVDDVHTASDSDAATDPDRYRDVRYGDTPAGRPDNGAFTDPDPSDTSMFDYEAAIAHDDGPGTGGDVHPADDGDGSSDETLEAQFLSPQQAMNMLEKQRLNAGDRKALKAAQKTEAAQRREDQRTEAARARSEKEHAAKTAREEAKLAKQSSRQRKSAGRNNAGDSKKRMQTSAAANKAASREETLRQKEAKRARQAAERELKRRQREERMFRDRARRLGMEIDEGASQLLERTRADKEQLYEWDVESGVMGGNAFEVATIDKTDFDLPESLPPRRIRQH
jgi:hypothetical protein